MGQYFTPVFLNTAGDIAYAMQPQDYGSGLKLAGHSRADTRLMYAVQTLLALDGSLRLVWAGDYADPEAGRDANLYYLTEPRHFLRFAGLICPDVKPNIELPQGSNPPGVLGYVCNADKQQYIENLTLAIDDTGWRRTPLPRLTAEGGQSGATGDLGSWARAPIYYSERLPGPDWTAVAPAG